MRFRLVLLAGLVTFAGAANAQPIAGAAVNAARFGKISLPGWGVAQGSMATLFGQNLPGTFKQVGAFPLTTTWENVSIEIVVNGTTVAAYPLILQNAFQLSFIVPSNTPVGDGTISVTVNGSKSAGVPIKILPRNFGIFTSNYSGQGPAVMQDPVTNARNSLTHAANPGEQLDIWGTGLGAVQGNEAAGPLPGDLASADVQVVVGGKQAQLVYKGRSGCCVGIDQIRFVVPQGVQGCAVPVYLKLNDTYSNYTTMSIATSGRICSDDTIGYTSEDLNRALTTGSLSTGNIILSRTKLKFSAMGFDIDNNSDSGFASFQKYTPDLLNIATNSSYGVTPIGSCMVYNQTGNDQTPNQVVTIPELDAGDPLTVTSPAGVAKQLKKVQGTKGVYSGTLGGGMVLPIPIPGVPAPEPLFLEPGVYAIRGPGGADVGAFNFNLAIPTPLTWTNIEQTPANISRAQDLPIAFTGGNNGDLVVIAGSSFSEDPQPDGVTASFVCTTRATGGPSTFNVPAAVLQQLPGTVASTDPTDFVPTGMLFVGSTTSPVTFTADHLDKGIAAASSLTGKGVSFN